MSNYLFRLITSNTEKIWESRTIWVGVLTLLISIFGFLQGEEWIATYPKVVAGIGTIVGIAAIVLRYLTKKPIKIM